LETKGQL